LGQRILTPEFVAKGFMELVDESKNGAVVRVTPQNGIDYVDYPNFKANNN